MQEVIVIDDSDTELDVDKDGEEASVVSIIDSEDEDNDSLMERAQVFRQAPPNGSTVINSHDKESNCTGQLQKIIDRFVARTRTLVYSSIADRTGTFSDDEKEAALIGVALHGPKWTLIKKDRRLATTLAGRIPTQIKDFYRSARNSNLHERKLCKLLGT